MLEQKRWQDAQELANRNREGEVDGLRRRAMTQAEMDEFNRRQLELKNANNQQEKAQNVQFAERRRRELEAMDHLTEQQRTELAEQRRLYGQTLQYQRDIQE